jgi:hypothetical protein
MSRLPPALAAAATVFILERLPAPPARVLELGFAGIHATPLRLAGYDVVVVEPDAAQRDRARERAGDVLAAIPPERFDAAIVLEGASLEGVDARSLVVVGHDGSVWSSASS